MTSESTCPTCGAQILATDRFCGECGADLSAAAKKPLAQRTMLGLPPREAGAQGVPAAVAQPEAAPPAPSPPATSAKPKIQPQATLLGIPPSLGLPGAPPGVAPVATPAKLPQATMLGVAPAAPPAAQAKPPRKDTPKRTMLGGVVAAVLGKPAPKANIPAVSDRTILGMQNASPGALPGAADDAHPEDDDAPLALPEDSLLSPRIRRVVAIGAGVLLALGAVALFGGRSDGLSVRVVQGAAGDELEISAASAAPGSKVRFAGKEQALSAGKARFPLTSDALHIGHNELGVSLVEPGGDARESRVALELDYRARFELGTLADPTPVATFVIDALPGAKVTLAGKPLALDAQGHAKSAVPVAPSEKAQVTLKVGYRVEAPDKPAVDAELKADLPSASVLLASPMDGLVTEAKEIQVSGSVGSDTHVVVAGLEAAVKDGRFERDVKLESPGKTTIAVVARAAGKAPRSITLGVERVASLAVAAANFQPDRGVSYAALTKDATALRGRHVAFDGRVYNVEDQGGRTVLQVLVNDCPRGERCPLWVELGERATFAKESSVRVLGSVLGEQQFRSKQGGVQTVPSVRAAFVLKVAK